MAHHSGDCFHVSPVLPGIRRWIRSVFLWKSMPVHFNPNSSPRRRPVVQVHVAAFIHAAFPRPSEKTLSADPVSGPSPPAAPPFAVCAALGRGCSDERLFRLYFHGGGRHLAKIPHCFAYKSFCFTAVLFALNVLLFQQLFIEPLYLQRGIARASGQSYQRIDSCGGGLCRDSFPSFDSVYQAAAGASGLPPLSYPQAAGSTAKLTGSTNTRLFFGKEFL